jgi:hypothetical protein
MGKYISCHKVLLHRKSDDPCQRQLVLFLLIAGIDELLLSRLPLHLCAQGVDFG